MILIGLINEGLAMLNALIVHFVDVTGVGGSAAGMAFVSDTNNEWIMVGDLTNYTVTAKGQALMGAVADIAVYGAVLGDWIIQALVGTSLGNFAGG